MAKRTTYNVDNFPFDLLRVGGAGKKDAERSEFNTTTQKTKIEVSSGHLEDYCIEFEELSSTAISYYIDPKGNNMMNPSFYLHPILHPAWSSLNEKGEVSHKTSPTGVRIEEFWDKFTAAFNRECLKIPEDDRFWMIGDGELALNPTEKSVFLEPIAKHPEYPKTHPKVGRRDLDKPKTLDMALWSMDVTKRSVDTDKKRKYSNIKSSYSGPSFTAAKPAAIEEKRNDDLLVPDTNAIIFTCIYDLTSVNKKKVGLIKSGEQVKDYGVIKKFIYNANAHPNASDKNSDLMVKTTILGPSINWDINGKPGSAKLKVKEIKITYHKPRDLNRAITIDEIVTQAEETRRKRIEFGLADSSDDDDDNENGNHKNQVEEKEPLFKTDFEKVNYYESRDCEKALKVLNDRYEALEAQIQDKNLAPLKMRAVEKEMSIILERHKKKQQELLDLQNELEEMQKEEMEVEGGNTSGNDYGEHDEDSMGSEQQRQKKIRVH